MPARRSLRLLPAPLLLLVAAGLARGDDPAPDPALRDLVLEVAGRPVRRGSDPRAEIRLVLSHPTGHFLRYRKESVLSALEDDKGTDLRRAPTPFEPNGVRKGPWSRDPHRTEVVLLGRAPAKGATTLRARGTLVFRFASKQQTLKVPAGPLAVGTTFRAGPLVLKVSHLFPHDGHDKSLARGGFTHLVKLEGDATLDTLADLRFVDAAGERVPSRRYGVARFVRRTGTTVRVSFALARVPARVRLRVVRWTDLRDLSIPFDLDVPLGEAPKAAKTPRPGTRDG